MSEEQVQNLTDNEIPAILDEDLANVDTSIPVLRGGQVHDFDIKSVEVSDNKQGTGKNLVITLSTTSDLPSTRGDIISAGFPCYVYIGLTPAVGRPDKKDYTEDDIRRALARFTLAVHGEKCAVQPIDKHIGKRVKCKISVTKPTAEYPNEGNNVTFVPA